MKGVVIIYTFYVDVFFVQNFLMDAIVLFFTAEFRKCGCLKVWLKILLSSFAGSILSVLLLLFGKSYLLFVIVSYVMIFPFMVWGSFGWNRIGYFCGNCVLSIFGAIFLGGVIEYMEEMFRFQRLYILTAGLAAVIAGAALRIFCQNLQRQKNLYSVQLKQNGKTVSCMALYDSGNFLREPYQKRPVQIVSAEVLETLLEGEEKMPLWIPYHSLGNQNGLLEIYTIDAICIQKGSRALEIAPAVAGCARKGLTGNQTYQVILNQNIWETERKFYGNKNPKHLEKSAADTKDRPKAGGSVLHRRGRRTAAAIGSRRGKSMSDGIDGACVPGGAGKTD